MAKRKTTKVKGSKGPKKRQTVDEKAQAMKPSKIDGHVYKSFYEDVEPSWKGVGGRTRFMICRNSIEGGKYWKGVLCGNWTAVGDEAVAVLCSRCSQALVPFEEKLVQRSTGRPRGWQFMNEFVDKDGNVFHKGVEQKDLKGTLPPTKIEKKDKPKLTKGQKQAKRNELLVDLNKLKKEYTKEKRKTYKAKIKTKMNKIQRELKKYK